jgi:dTDP-4-dehydrorhamnose reductase
MAVGRPRILLTGTNGQVGGDTLPLLQPFAEVYAPGRSELDLADEQAIRRCVRHFQPRWIINPAAYTAVDRAESEPELAEAINATAPRVLGEEAARLGAAVIHLSTDYVFDGSGSTPWVETDSPHPLSIYGRTKLEGEQALAASGALHVILRTSWVYSAHGRNFVRTMLQLTAERGELKIVADQFGAPTWSGDLARLLAHIVQRAEERALEAGSLGGALAGRQGIFHAASAGETSWFGLTEEIVRVARSAQPSQPRARLVPIASAEYPTSAKRPGNSRLCCDRLKAQWAFEFPRWQESVRSVLDQLLVP